MNSKHCPRCNFSIFTVKIGKTSSGRQRYKCKNCCKTWTSKTTSSKINKKIWNDFVFHNFNVEELSSKYQKSEKTIRNILHQYEVPSIAPRAPADVIVMDVTYFGRSWGILTVLNAHTGDCLYCEETRGYETTWDYERAIKELAKYNIHPKACVIDIKRGVAEMLEGYGIKVQFCQFHQLKIITKYLTRKPVLQPNAELRDIALSLTHTTEKNFTYALAYWRLHHLTWLEEKTHYDNGRWEYTHKPTRSAIKSLLNNSSYLFTYERNPELGIPNTNNKIEGVHSEIKRRLANHRGCGKTLRIKIVRSFLSGRTGV